MSFFEIVVDTHCARDEWASTIIVQSSHKPAACFATRPGGEMEDGQGGGMEGGRERGRAEEVSQSRKE